MKILHVSTGVQRIPPDKIGSPEGHITLLSRELAKMGHEVTIVDRMHSASDAPYDQFGGVSIVRLPVKSFCPLALEGKLPFLFWLRSGINTILFTLRVNRWLKYSSQFDVINTYVISTTFLLVVLNRKLRKGIIYNHHAAFWPSRTTGLLSRFLIMLGSFTTKRIKGVIVLNDSMREWFINRFRLAESSVKALPPGIDINMFTDGEIDNDIRAKYQLSGRKVILFVGRINPMKGLEYLVEAANIVVNRSGHRDSLFLLAGPFENVEIDRPGGYTTQILNMIKRFKLEDHVKLTGTVPLDDLRNLYIVCDLFVLPSIVEQFPLVILEAMASGKPVVASNTPGALMQVINGRNGFLVEIGSQEGLAERIGYLLDNSEEAKQMGAKAREDARELDWSKLVGRYLEAYCSY